MGVRVMNVANHLDVHD